METVSLVSVETGQNGEPVGIRDPEPCRLNSETSLRRCLPEASFLVTYVLKPSRNPTSGLG